MLFCKLLLSGSPDSTGGQFRPKDGGDDPSNAASPDNFNPPNVNDIFQQAFQNEINTPTAQSSNSWIKPAATAGAVALALIPGGAEVEMAGTLLTEATGEALIPMVAEGA